MSSAAIHIVHRNPTAKRRQRLPEARNAAPCNVVQPDRAVNSRKAEPQLSTTPQSDPVEILRLMPAQVVTPALLELLDLLSSPILLIENSPTGELREMVEARPALAIAA